MTGGDLTLRWYGTSNGYYSEEVSVMKLTSTVPDLLRPLEET